ncbi:hypothetical protein [Acinetobacter calcoaceticus]|uniref:hypothetical protein n=1 Tax=Acinetobacter calcoaceticus TaxID=471 RepID=UPI00249076EA|nr:hypothetical protein [Acinetobacter calcoaceticus]
MNKADLTIYTLHFLSPNQNNKSNLSPYGYWVLIRFIQAFGTEGCSIPLQQLSTQIGVQHKKLRKVIDELQQANLLIVSYPEQGQRARVRHIKLSNEYFENLQVNGEKTSERYKRDINKIRQRLALYPMIEKLLEVIETISINALEGEDDLDFHSALLLLTLLKYSNRFGIVMGCGNAEIYKATGLKKQSMYKYLYKLMNLRFIRSRAEGSIRNAFISVEDPIYSLNLSHSFWGEAAIYGRFYIIEYPEKHQFEVKRLAYAKHRTTGKIKKEDPDVESQNFLRDPVSYLFQSKVRNRESFIQYQQAEYEHLLKVIEEFYTYLFNADGELSEQSKKYLKLIRFDQLGTSELKAKVYSYNQGDGLLQCYLEQHCSELYSNDTLLYRLISQDIDVRFQHFGKEDLFSGKKYYREEPIDTKFNEELTEEGYKEYLSESAEVGKRQALFKIVLMSALDLIAFNQINLFFKIFKEFEEQERVSNKNHKVLLRRPAFRILPRSMEQTRYSCTFVPDTELKEDQFFYGEVKVRTEPLSISDELGFIIIESQQKRPTDEQLEQYGILSRKESKKTSAIRAQLSK